MLQNIVKILDKDSVLSTSEIYPFIGKQIYILNTCQNWRWNNNRYAIILNIEYKPVLYPTRTLSPTCPSRIWEMANAICVNDPLERPFYVHPACIRLVEPVTPYPHKCNRCHSSARKIGGLYLCSNVRCGNTKQIRINIVKSIKIKTEVKAHLNGEPLLCHNCGKCIDNFCVTEQKHIYELYCVCGYTWLHKVEYGQVSFFRGMKYRYSLYGWVPYTHNELKT